MKRGQAKKLIMIMVAVFLTYSAYFLSNDFHSVSTFMNVKIVSITNFIDFNDSSLLVARSYQHSQPKTMHYCGSSIQTSEQER